MICPECKIHTITIFFEEYKAVMKCHRCGYNYLKEENRGSK